MITVEGSYDSSRNPKEAFSLIYGFFNQSAPTEKIPNAHMIVLEDNFAVILRPNYFPRSKEIESLTALLIRQIDKPDSTCIASFTISECGLLNLNLPSENILLNDSSLVPFSALAFDEEINFDLAPVFSDWLEKMVCANRYISPPRVFVSECSS